MQKTEAKISLFRMIYCCTRNPRYDSGRIIALPPDEVRKLIVCINVCVRATSISQHVRTCALLCAQLEVRNCAGFDEARKGEQRA